MKKTILCLVSGCIFMVSCRKDIYIYDSEQITAACELQTANPAGRSYSSDSVINYQCTSKHCGILPLNSKNYWVYQDSIFSDGIFIKVQYDTLRFSSNLKTLPDNLVWWETNINIGLPDFLYTNDSAFFSLEERLYTLETKEAKKGFSLFPGDSLRYITSFEDAAAIGRSLKLESAIQSPAGSFSGCIYFEKNARNYRKDQVFFKPGLGVIRYVQEKARMGERVLRLQQVSTLVDYHLE